MSYQGETPIPEGVAKMLDPGEEVLAAVSQSRLKSPITPDTLVVTNQRIIKHSPANLGLTVNTTNFLFQDVSTFEVKKDLLFAAVTIRLKGMGEDLVIGSLEKPEIDSFANVVNGLIKAARNPEPRPTPAPASSPAGSTDDPLKALKLRYAKGEITKEQFEEIRAMIE